MKQSMVAAGMVALVVLGAASAQAQILTGIAMFEQRCGRCHSAPAAGSRAPDRVALSQLTPERVLEAIHAILGDRFLWGSDNPFMSWCDDQLRLLYSYADEARVLRSWLTLL